MKVIEKKNGYTLAITNQGHGDRIILMFPGETEKNPHSWLGEPTASNLASAKKMLNEFAGKKSRDSKIKDAVWNGWAVFVGKTFVQPGGFIKHNSKEIIKNSKDAAYGYAKTLVSKLNGDKYVTEFVVWVVEYKDNREVGQRNVVGEKKYDQKVQNEIFNKYGKKINDSKSVLANALKALDSIEEKLATKPQGEVDANNIIADKRMFIKLYEDVCAENNKSNGRMLLTKMQKTLSNIEKNVESDFDQEDVDKFKRLLEIAQRKVDRMSM